MICFMKLLSISNLHVQSKNNIMLLSKDIKSVDELKKYFADPQKMVDHLVDLLSFFEFKRVFKILDPIKKRGFAMSQVFSLILLFPFLHHASVHALFKSGNSKLASGQKDVYYRFKNRVDIPWRRLLINFVRRFLVIVELRGQSGKPGERCLIIDDSLLGKTGKAIEFVGRLWDHVTHGSKLGLRLLLSCYYDGKSTIPVDFSIHREKGKNDQKPYGLTKKQLKGQYRKCRQADSQGCKRESETDKTKSEVGMEMIKRALGYLPVDYVLMDSWFTSGAMIQCVRGYTKQNVHLIGMMKMGNAQYSYEGKLYGADQLQRMGKRMGLMNRCRKLNASYIVMEAEYKEYPVKLFFSRFGQRGKWHLILSTDTSLGYMRLMELYQIRWTIEVLFKEGKQYLNLGGCQSKDFDAQIADTTITMIQYILLTLRKRFDDYDTRGEIFRDVGEQMQERTLHARLWDLLVAVMKIIMESFDIIIEDIDVCIARLINQDKLKGILELLSPNHKVILS